MNGMNGLNGDKCRSFFVLFFGLISVFSGPQDASRVLWNHCWLFRNGFERKVSLSKLRLTREMQLLFLALSCLAVSNVKDMFSSLARCNGAEAGYDFSMAKQYNSPGLDWRSRLVVLQWWRMRKLPSSPISVQPSKRWVKVGNGNVA